MDDFDLEIKKEFINEALINLEEAEGSFMELETASDHKPLLDKIFRLAHNLKGGSRAVGFGDVAEFTHQLENLVLKIQKNEVALNSDVVTTLLRSNDRLVEMLSELKGNLSATFNNADLLQDIQNWLDGKSVSTPAAEAPKTAAAPPAAENSTPSAPLAIEDSVPMTPVSESTLLPTEEVIPTPSAFEAVTVVSSLKAEAETSDPDSVPHVPDASSFFAEAPPVVSPQASASPTSVEAPAPASPSSSPAAQAAVEKVEAESSDSGKAGRGGDGKGKEKEDEIIRVSLSRIDLLNDYVGELIVLQSVIQQQIGPQIQGKLPVSLRQMVKLSKDIQTLSMSLRMLPVKPLVQKLQRVVRDTAKTLNKGVSFEVIGDHLDVDKSVLDRLADPLIHILRNAVDHGLETPEGRQKANKKAEGKVTLSFSNEGNHLVVEVTDDGKGIDGEVLKKKAIEKHLITESQALTEKQLIHLIFHPGFSTKSETSEISGRGVGMDVVKTNVEKIGGQVDVTTQVGRGSLFRMQIPLSLAVIEGLVVTSENSRYVVPLNQVQETINLKSQKIYQSRLGIGSCFELRGSVVPLINVEEALGLKPDSQINPSHTGLIVNVGDQLLALVVKDIVRAQQIVIKPLGNGIMSQKGWIGSCVLGDGLPTLIVSPVDLLEGRITQNLFEQNAGGAA